MESEREKQVHSPEPSQEENRDSSLQCLDRRLDHRVDGHRSIGIPRSVAAVRRNRVLGRFDRLADQLEHLESLVDDGRSVVEHRSDPALIDVKLEVAKSRLVLGDANLAVQMLNEVIELGKNSTDMQSELTLRVLELKRAVDRMHGFTDFEDTAPVSDSLSLADLERAVDRLDFGALSKFCTADFRELMSDLPEYAFYLNKLGLILGSREAEAWRALGEIDLPFKLRSRYTGYPRLLLTALQAEVLLARNERQRAYDLVWRQPNRDDLPLALSARVLFSLQRFSDALNVAQMRELDLRTTPRERLALQSTEVACLFELGREPEALIKMGELIVGSSRQRTLVPLSLIPEPTRTLLIRKSAGRGEWSVLAEAMRLPRDEVISRIRRASSSKVQTVTHGLSHRDRHLVSLIDKLESTSAIARELSVAQGTVKNRLSALYKKIGVGGWDEAKSYGYKHGILPADDLRTIND